MADDPMARLDIRSSKQKVERSRWSVWSVRGLLLISTCALVDLMMLLNIFYVQIESLDVHLSPTVLVSSTLPESMASFSLAVKPKSFLHSYLNRVDVNSIVCSVFANLDVIGGSDILIFEFQLAEELPSLQARSSSFSVNFGARVPQELLTKRLADLADVESTRITCHGNVKIVFFFFLPLSLSDYRLDVPYEIFSRQILPLSVPSRRRLFFDDYHVDKDVDPLSTNEEARFGGQNFEYVKLFNTSMSPIWDNDRMGAHVVSTLDYSMVHFFDIPVFIHVPKLQMIFEPSDTSTYDDDSLLVESSPLLLSFETDSKQKKRETTVSIDVTASSAAGRNGTLLYLVGSILWRFFSSDDSDYRAFFIGRLNLISAIIGTEHNFAVRTTQISPEHIGTSSIPQSARALSAGSGLVYTSDTRQKCMRILLDKSVFSNGCRENGDSYIGYSLNLTLGQFPAITFNSAVSWANNIVDSFRNQVSAQFAVYSTGTHLLLFLNLSASFIHSKASTAAAEAETVVADVAANYANNSNAHQACHAQFRLDLNSSRNGKVSVVANSSASIFFIALRARWALTDSHDQTLFSLTIRQFIFYLRDQKFIDASGSMSSTINGAEKNGLLLVALDAISNSSISVHSLNVWSRQDAVLSAPFTLTGWTSILLPMNSHQKLLHFNYSTFAALEDEGRLEIIIVESIMHVLQCTSKFSWFLNNRTGYIKGLSLLKDNVAIWNVASDLRYNNGNYTVAATLFPSILCKSLSHFSAQGAFSGSILSGNFAAYLKNGNFTTSDKNSASHNGISGLIEMKRGTKNRQFLTINASDTKSGGHLQTDFVSSSFGKIFSANVKSFRRKGTSGHLGDYLSRTSIKWNLTSPRLRKGPQFGLDLYSSLDENNKRVYLFDSEAFYSQGESSSPSGQPSGLPTSRPSTSMPTSFPTGYCAAGTFVVGGRCLPCPSGASTLGKEMATFCTACLAGTFASGTGNPTCTNCDLGFYGPLSGAEGCTICPGGRTTPAKGSTQESQCVSPAVNFVTGIIAFGVCLVLACEYVALARYHRVAFLRKTRIVENLAIRCKSVAKRISRLVAEAEVKNIPPQGGNRLVRTWFFILLSVIMIFTIGLIIFLCMIASIFFKSLILFHGWKIGVNFRPYQIILNDAVQGLVEILSGIIPASIIRAIFSPLIEVFVALSNLHIDLSTINVTCSGSQAPLELLINLIILGAVIIIVESGYDAFRTISFNTVTDSFLSYSTLPEYREMVFTQRFWSKSKYARVLMLGCVVTFLGKLNMFSSVLQYLMGFIQIESFFQTGSVFHASTSSCDRVQGYTNIDTTLAVSSTLLVWIILLPIVYELSKVLVPGLGKGSLQSQTQIETHDEIGQTTHPSSNNPLYPLSRNHSLSYKSRYFLVISTLSGFDEEQRFHSLVSHLESLRKTRTIDSDSRKPIINFLRRYSTLSMKMMSFFAPDLLLASASFGLIDSLYCSTLQFDSTLYDELSKKYFESDTNIMPSLQTHGLDVDDGGCDQGLNSQPGMKHDFADYQRILKLVAGLTRRPNSRTTHSSSDISNASDTQCRIFEFLNALDQGLIGCQQQSLSTFSTLSTLTTLSEAVQELVDTENLLKDKCFKTTNLQDWFVLAPFKLETLEETKRWTEKTQKILPNYYSLCLLEYLALKVLVETSDKFGPRQKFVLLKCGGLFLFILFGFGHFCSEIGRIVFRIILRKLFHFVFIVLGIWTERGFDEFDIQNTVEALSVYGEKDKFLGAIDNASNSYQGEELFEDEKSKLRQDYSNACAAAVSSRAIIFQLVPQLTILSVFASTTCASPIYASNTIASKLPELFISHPFYIARKQEEEHAEDLRRRTGHLSQETTDFGSQNAGIATGSRVQCWHVAFKGVLCFVCQSRGVQFLLNLYMFSMSVGILFMNSNLWIVCSAAILLPYAFVRSTVFVMVLGKALGITDADLIDALNLYTCVDFCNRLHLQFESVSKSQLPQQDPEIKIESESEIEMKSEVDIVCARSEHELSEESPNDEALLEMPQFAPQPPAKPQRLRSNSSRPPIKPPRPDNAHVHDHVVAKEANIAKPPPKPLRSEHLHNMALRSQESLISDFESAVSAGGGTSHEQLIEPPEKPARLSRPFDICPVSSEEASEPLDDHPLDDHHDGHVKETELVESGLGSGYYDQADDSSESIIEIDRDVDEQMTK